jgi:hypothetical protein
MDTQKNCTMFHETVLKNLKLDITRDTTYGSINYALSKGIWLQGKRGQEACWGAVSALWIGDILFFVQRLHVS